MPIEVSGFTRFLMDDVQIAALLFMGIAIVVKVKWILRFPAAVERTAPKGDERKAIRYAFATLALPSEIESQRVHWVRYVEFVLFHIAVFVTIAVTFIMPYWPHLIGGRLTIKLLRIVIGLGLLAGLVRAVRRFARPEMRAISSPDDYFSIVALVVWLTSAMAAVKQQSEAAIIVFFGLTAFFLIYVPFSKISHYIYWPFIRYYVGRHLGHRGVYPKKAVSDART